MSFVEATIILAVISALSAVVAPSINDYIQESKDAKAKAEVEVLGTALTRMLVDTGEIAVWRDGNGTLVTDPPSHLAANRVDMLVSDGTIPTVATARGAGTDWNSALDNLAVQALGDHLVLNTPSGLAANRYRNGADMNIPDNFDPNDAGSFNADYAWRGAYLPGPVGSDPWGRRYAINVEFLAKATGVGVGVSGSVNDVFVLCTGQDGVANTPYETLLSTGRDGATALGDNIIYVVSGGTR